jgi:glutamate formiminotransferase
MCVGARPILIAYNLWLKDSTLDVAKRICAEIRSESVRTLALQVGSSVQVSITGPDKVYDAVAQFAEIDRAELVGLVPSRTLAAIPRQRWAQLDLSTETTIEWNLAERNRKLRA